MEQNIPSQRQAVSEALATARAYASEAPSVRFPSEDGVRSLVEMAQRDLDAALQLLADRAQYITGASGAAIALLRDGRSDMLCRASVGSNAPELGALLSTEVGLSGESVRTRRLMRCDDAERDARVNREVCRQLGIASVLVMPVVNDDKVLGVFELFSGKANAFGDRDLSTMQRLSEMVETAICLANATETLPEQLSVRESSVAEAVHPEVFEGQFLGDLVVEGSKPVAEVKPPLDEQSVETIAAAALESPLAEQIPPAVKTSPKVVMPEGHAPAAPMFSAQATAVPTSSPVKKTLFWSAAAAGEADAAQTVEAGQSHVPPVLRGLRKCEACGFPVSAGRVLCVECEEKKWRGQLRLQAPSRKPPAAVSASKPLGGSFAAAAPSMAKSAATSTQGANPDSRAAMGPSATAPLRDKPPERTTGAVAASPEISPRPEEIRELVLSAGIEPSRSWFAAHKYIVLVLAAIGVAAVALLLLR